MCPRGGESPSLLAFWFTGLPSEAIGGPFVLRMEHLHAKSKTLSLAFLQKCVYKQLIRFIAVSPPVTSDNLGNLLKTIRLYN